MAAIQIKHRFTEAVLFECEAPEDLGSGLHQRHALEKAVGARAYLGGAYLGGAYLDELKLVGQRPVVAIGPIGSRNDYLMSFLPDKGIYLRAGCFFGTVDEFTTALAREHGTNEHAQEYTAALVLIECHAKLWTPATEEAAA